LNGSFWEKKPPHHLPETIFGKIKLHPEDVIKIQKSVNKAISNPLTNRWELEYEYINNAGRNKLYVMTAE